MTLPRLLFLLVLASCGGSSHAVGASDAGSSSSTDASSAIRSPRGPFPPVYHLDGGRIVFASSQPGHLHRENNFIDGPGIVSAIVDNTTAGQCDITISATTAPTITGSANTQSQTFPNYVQLGRTTTASGTVVLSVPIPTAVACNVSATIIGRTVVAGTAGSIGDTASLGRECAFRNNAGTAAQVGATFPLISVSDTSMTGATGTCGVSTSNGTVTATASATNGNPTIDWTIQASVTCD